MTKEISSDEALGERLQKKHVDSFGELIDFRFGSNRVQVQSTIATELLNVNKDEARKTFEELCIAFSKVCLEYHIKFDPIDVFVLVSDELEAGASKKSKRKDDGSYFAVILIPVRDFSVHEFWKYAFVHELGHSWLSVKVLPEDKKLGYEDLLIDLISICVFRKILPPHKRVYREVRKHRPFFLTRQTKKFLGKELYRQILQDPEAYLEDLRERICPAKG